MIELTIWQHNEVVWISQRLSMLRKLKKSIVIADLLYLPYLPNENLRTKDLSNN